MPPVNLNIKKAKLLIVEGKDEENFFTTALERHLLIPEIQVMDIGGKTVLLDRLKALVSVIDFTKVTTLAIIRDADFAAPGSTTPAAVSAFNSVAGSLTDPKVGLSAPPIHGQFSIGLPRVGIFIMPDGVNEGMLETLCLDSVSTNPEMQCVEDFFACCAKSGTVPNNLSKAKAHAWLASRPEPDKRVGEAAKAGYWPFASTTFDKLWEFLRAI